MCKELITSAAIRIANDGEYIFIKGKSHSDCMMKAIMQSKDPNLSNIDPANKGFWTTMSRFVNRSEAYRIAKEGNQITNDFIKGVLYSENVKYEGTERIL